MIAQLFVVVTDGGLISYIIIIDYLATLRSFSENSKVDFYSGASLQALNRSNLMLEHCYLRFAVMMLCVIWRRIHEARPSYRFGATIRHSTLGTRGLLLVIEQVLSPEGGINLITLFHIFIIQLFRINRLNPFSQKNHERLITFYLFKRCNPSLWIKY